MKCPAYRCAHAGYQPVAPDSEAIIHMATSRLREADRARGQADKRACGKGASMKCLRIYATADGESHFDEVALPTHPLQVHPAAAAFDVSARYAAAHISFTRIPAGARRVDWHTVPGRVLTVRLDGAADYTTSDGDRRHVPAGGFILFEDTHGKGHRTEHSPHAQTMIWIGLPHGLDPAA